MPGSLRYALLCFAVDARRQNMLAGEFGVLVAWFDQKQIVASINVYST